MTHTLQGQTKSLTSPLNKVSMVSQAQKWKKKKPKSYVPCSNAVKNNIMS